METTLAQTGAGVWLQDNDLFMEERGNGLSYTTRACTANWAIGKVHWQNFKHP